MLWDSSSIGVVVVARLLWWQGCCGGKAVVVIWSNMDTLPGRYVLFCKGSNKRVWWWVYRVVRVCSRLSGECPAVFAAWREKWLVGVSVNGVFRMSWNWMFWVEKKMVELISVGTLYIFFFVFSISFVFFFWEHWNSDCFFCFRYILDINWLIDWLCIAPKQIYKRFSNINNIIGH